MIKYCQGCGGRLGVDCWNEGDCVNISRSMEQDFRNNYLNDLECYSLFKVIKDWFLVRFWKLRQRFFPKKFNDDEIPF